MNSLFKKLGILAVSSVITLGSYGYAVADEKKQDYSFDSFGKKEFKKLKITAVATADVDGDGDQDIIIGYGVGYNPSIYIIENKMPQKNKESTEEKYRKEK